MRKFLCKGSLKEDQRKGAQVNNQITVNRNSSSLNKTVKNVLKDSKITFHDAPNRPTENSHNNSDLLFNRKRPYDNPYLQTSKRKVIKVVENVFINKLPEYQQSIISGILDNAGQISQIDSIASSNESAEGIISDFFADSEPQNEPSSQHLIEYSQDLVDDYSLEYKEPDTKERVTSDRHGNRHSYNGDGDDNYYNDTDIDDTAILSTTVSTDTTPFPIISLNNNISSIDHVTTERSNVHVRIQSYISSIFLPIYSPDSMRRTSNSTSTLKKPPNIFLKQKNVLDFFISQKSSVATSLKPPTIPNMLNKATGVSSIHYPLQEMILYNRMPKLLSSILPMTRRVLHDVVISKMKPSLLKFGMTQNQAFPGDRRSHTPDEDFSSYGSNGRKGSVSCIKFDRQGSLLAVCSTTGLIRVFDFDLCIQALYSSKYVTSSASDYSHLQQQQLSENAALTQQPVLTLHTRQRVTALEWSSASPDEIAVAFYPGKAIHIYDLGVSNDAKVMLTTTRDGGVGGSGGYTCLLYLGTSGNIIVATTRSGIVRCWDIRKPKSVLWEIDYSPGHQSGYVSLLAVSSDVLATCFPRGSGSSDVSSVINIPSIGNNNNNGIRNHDKLSKEASSTESHTTLPLLLTVTASGIFTLWDTAALNYAAFGTIAQPTCLHRLRLWDSFTSHRPSAVKLKRTASNTTSTSNTMDNSSPPNRDPNILVIGVTAQQPTVRTSMVLVTLTTGDVYRFDLTDGALQPTSDSMFNDAQLLVAKPVFPVPDAFYSSSSTGTRTASTTADTAATAPLLSSGDGNSTKLCPAISLPWTYNAVIVPGRGVAASSLRYDTLPSPDLLPTTKTSFNASNVSNLPATIKTSNRQVLKYKKCSEHNLGLPGVILEAAVGCYEILTTADLREYLCHTSVAAATLGRASTIKLLVQRPTTSNFSTRPTTTSDPDSISLSCQLSAQYVYEIECVTDTGLRLQQPYNGPAVSNRQPAVSLLTMLQLDCGPITSHSSSCTGSRAASTQVSTVGSDMGLYNSNITSSHRKSTSTIVPYPISATEAHPKLPYVVTGCSNNDIVLLTPDDSQVEVEVVHDISNES